MTHTDQHTQSPGTPPGGRPRTHHASLRTVLGSAVAVTTVAGAAVLAVLTLASDDQTEATGRPLTVERDDDHTSQGSSRDEAGPSAGRAPTCWWTSKISSPVFPAEDLGPPTPESVLIFERCNGGWTGDIAWSNPGDGPEPGSAASGTASSRPWEDERFDTCVEAETRRRPPASSDDGLPNPWEAGSIAATCYLLTHTSGTPSTPALAPVTDAP